MFAIEDNYNSLTGFTVSENGLRLFAVLYEVGECLEWRCGDLWRRVDVKRADWWDFLECNGVINKIAMMQAAEAEEFEEESSVTEEGLVQAWEDLAGDLTWQQERSAEAEEFEEESSVTEEGLVQAWEDITGDLTWQRVRSDIRKSAEYLLEAQAVALAEAQRLKEIHDNEMKRTLQKMKEGNDTAMVHIVFGCWHEYAADVNKSVAFNKMAAEKMSHTNAKSEHIIGHALVMWDSESKMRLLHTVLKLWNDHLSEEQELQAEAFRQAE